jgi:hypothetical protein
VVGVPIVVSMVWLVSQSLLVVDIPIVCSMIRVIGQNDDVAGWGVGRRVFGNRDTVDQEECRGARFHKKEPLLTVV